jgi:hypothetical protein
MLPNRPSTFVCTCMQLLSYFPKSPFQVLLGHILHYLPPITNSLTFNPIVLFENSTITHCPPSNLHILATCDKRKYGSMFFILFITPCNLLTFSFKVYTFFFMFTSNFSFSNYIVTRLLITLVATSCSSLI